jgi:hypothetical protein
MIFTLGTAATACGISKSTVLRAIRSHRISANKNDVGDWSIEASELFRVFPPARNGEDGATERDATPAERHETAVHEAQIAGLRELAEVLRSQLDDVRADRDHWCNAAEAGQRLLAPPERRSWWCRMRG